MSDSIFSLGKVAEIDDSASYLWKKKRCLSARKEAMLTVIFSFSKDYLGGLRAGLRTDLGLRHFLPKYALGNWWSCYYAYRQQEYIDLMIISFKRRTLTVATIEMDWQKNVPKDAPPIVNSGERLDRVYFLIPDYSRL